MCCAVVDLFITSYYRVAELFILFFLILIPFTQHTLQCSTSASSVFFSTNLFALTWFACLIAPHHSFLEVSREKMKNARQQQPCSLPCFFALNFHSFFVICSLYSSQQASWDGWSSWWWNIRRRKSETGFSLGLSDFFFCLCLQSLLRTDWQSLIVFFFKKGRFVHVKGIQLLVCLYT